MKINLHVSVDLFLPQPVPGLLQIEARHFPDAQRLESSQLSVTPFAETEPFLDFYDNPCRRLQFPAGEVHVEYHAAVSLLDKRLPMLQPVEADALHLPTETLLYTLPSRYCQSDRLLNMAQDQFGDAPLGWARVQTICEWIHRHVTYQYGTSDAGTSAYDTAAQRQGVCRDFAHLGIAFCRALGIPARYVSGYCLGLDPPDFHAWFQAFLDGRWVSFDATKRQPRPALVIAGLGRDAADCAWSTFFGDGETRSLSVEISTEADAGCARQTDL
jgi:transglutaminase-like putative cysteine protease